MKSLLAGGAVIAASFIGLGAAGPVAAQTPPVYPPTVNVNITLNLSITIINIGGTVNVTFLGCLIGETVQIDFNGATSFTACFGAGGGTARSLQAPAVGGTATASITAPSTPGEYPVTATGLTSGFSATQVLTVVGAGVATPEAPATPAAESPAAGNTASTSLPSTGAESSQTLLIAGGALLAGLGLAGVGYRRRQHSAAA